MNVNPLILSALSAIYTFPIYPDVYSGANDTDKYIVFQYLDDRPVTNGDNTDLVEEVTIRVNYYTKYVDNLQADKKAIKKALRGAGFTLISTGEVYDKEEEKYHIFVDAWIAGDVEDVET